MDILKTEIEWFQSCKMRDSQRREICQCGTESVIEASSDQNRMRAFLMVVVFFDQFIYTHYRSVYTEFQSEFPIPKLKHHVLYNLHTSPSWLIYDKKVNWSSVSAIANGSVQELKLWLKTKCPELSVDLEALIIQEIWSSFEHVHWENMIRAFGLSSLAEKIISEEIGLSNKLVEFDREVIRKENPDTPENQRLLRPAMLEAFLEYLPVDKSEFRKFIPFNLRQSINVAEGKFLEGVLEIIMGARNCSEYKKLSQERKVLIQHERERDREIERQAAKQRPKREEKRLYSAQRRSGPERENLIQKLSKMSIRDQLIYISKDDIYAPNFYPTKCAASADISLIESLPEETKHTLVLKLKGKHRGPWGAFKKRLLTVYGPVGNSEPWNI